MVIKPTHWLYMHDCMIDGTSTTVLNITTQVRTPENCFSVRLSMLTTNATLHARLYDRWYNLSEVQYEYVHKFRINPWAYVPYEQIHTKIVLSNIFELF